MAETNLANLINPQVFADLIAAKFPGKLVVGQFADMGNTLENQPGDTITFPAWNALTEMAELTESVAMGTEALGQTSTSATVKEFGKAVEVSDKALLSGLGDPLGQAAEQFAILAARRIDKSLIDIAVSTVGTSPLQVTSNSTNLTTTVLVNAIAQFGDIEPDEFDGLVIHSRQRADMLKDSNFIDASKLGGDGVLRRGQIGTLYGVPVFTSDRVTTVDIDAGAPVDLRYQALLLKKGALGLVYKRRPIVESDRDILKRTNALTTNVHYAVKRLDDKGVCVIQTNVGAIS